ncbi:MAG TPA: ATP-binding protein [Actinomycetota bacterium]|nr:ATP-binding protein [Actinomycetota bacterium]
MILPPDKSAPLLARSALNEAIPPPVLDSRFDDARLAASEIVTNAVRHADLDQGRDVIRMVIEADDDHVRVEVDQRTPLNDVRLLTPGLGLHRVGGFGLRLVEHMADDWGYEAGPPGNVWFEFRTS